MKVRSTKKFCRTECYCKFCYQSFNYELWISYTYVYVGTDKHSFINDKFLRSTHLVIETPIFTLVEYFFHDTVF